MPAVVDRVIECKLDVLQTLYSFASPATYGPAIEKLHQAGMGVVAMKVMAKIGAPRPGRGPAGALARPANFAPAALKWVIKNPSIATTVPSMTDIDQLEQNFKVMAEEFTDADAKLLTARLEEITPYFCRMCGECEGQCPKGCRSPTWCVSSCMRTATASSAWAGSTSSGWPPSTRQCGAATARPARSSCPHGVHVAQRLMRAQELFA